MPKHIIIFIVLFTVTGLAGGGAWYWTSTQLEEEIDRKNKVQSDIRRLQGKGIFPSASNKKKIEENQVKVHEIVEKLTPKLKKTNSVLQDYIKGSDGLPPTDWKQLFDQKRNELDTLAQSKQIELPEKDKAYYYQFGIYKARTPQPDRTHFLGVQLAAIYEVTKTLFDSEIVKLLRIERAKPGKQEERAPVGGGQRGQATSKFKAKVIEGPNKLYTIYPFEFSFTSSPEALKKFLNKIVQSELFFVVRYVGVENKGEVPLQSEIKPQAAPASSGFQAQPASKGSQNLIVPIYGQENIDVLLRIDFIKWNGQQDSKTANAANKKKALKNKKS